MRFSRIGGDREKRKRKCWWERATKELKYSQAAEKTSMRQLKLNSAAAEERKYSLISTGCRKSVRKAAEERQPDPAEGHGQDTKPYPIQ